MSNDTVEEHSGGTLRCRMCRSNGDLLKHGNDVCSICYTRYGYDRVTVMDPEEYEGFLKRDSRSAHDMSGFLRFYERHEIPEHPAKHAVFVSTVHRIMDHIIESDSPSIVQAEELNVTGDADHG